MLEGDIGGDDNRAALVTPSHYPKGSSTEITLCAEVAGLTNISQNIPPWINGNRQTKRTWFTRDFLV